jgi:hypothetical protein
MIYKSAEFPEVGAFCPEAAALAAVAMLNGEYETEFFQRSGRFVLKDSDAVEEVLTRVGLYAPYECDDYRTRVYAQDIAIVDRKTFPGLPWHIDVDSHIGTTEVESFDFNTGSVSSYLFTGHLVSLS